MLVSIIVPVKDGIEHLVPCIASLYRHTDLPFELIVVDNGSGTATGSYLDGLAIQNQQSVKLIRNAFNFGFPVAVNQGMSIARGEVIVLLNSDTEVSTGWLEGLLAELQSDVGIVGPCGTNISGAQNVAAEADWKPGQGWDTDRLVGFCLAIKRDVIDAIGGLDPRYGIGNFDDDDYCLRARLAGYRLRVAGNVLVRHVGHATFDRERIDLGPLMQVNAKKFLHKWRSLGLSGSSIAEMIASGREIASADLRIPFPATLHPRISLCMIVRDEEAYLADCLNSVEGAVDEICLVDTGSRDRTVEIAKQFGAKIRHFSWCDDFSAARNAALDIATGDWILVLDADERLKSQSIAELRWLSHNPLEFGAVCQVESTQAGRKIVSPVLRFFRNGIRIRYEGRLHEQPLIPGESAALDMSGIRITHLGYEPDVIASRGKLARNLLLAQQMADESRHFHSVFNLTRAHWEMEDYPQAAKFAAEAKELAATPADVIHAATMEIAATGATENYQSALRLAESLRDRFPMTPRVVFMAGKLLALLGRYEEAMEALDWRQSPDLRAYLSCNFAPSDLASPGTQLPEACDIYTACAIKLGKPEEAIRYLQDAISVVPTPDPTLYARLSKLLMIFGQWQAAGEAMNLALKLDPRLPNGWQQMETICAEIGRADLASSAKRNAERVSV